MGDKMPTTSDPAAERDETKGQDSPSRGALEPAHKPRPRSKVPQSGLDLDDLFNDMPV